MRRTPLLPLPIPALLAATLLWTTPLSTTLLSTTLLSTTLSAQVRPPSQPPVSHEGLLPFRSPNKPVDVPEELFHDLQILQNVLDDPEGYTVGVDEEGRPTCDHPTWVRTHAELQKKLFNMATVFGIVLRDCQSPNQRRLAALGAFFSLEIEHVFELIEFLPGEPERSIREEALPRAIDFLAVHLPKNRTPENDDAADRPPLPLYDLELGPFLGLLEVDDPRDQVQGLWFLTRLVEIRPSAGPILFDYGRWPLRRLLVAPQKIVRSHARDLLAVIDPQRRPPPPFDAGPDEQLAWLDAVVYELFPPVREISDGLIEIYPGADRDAIVEVGTEVLRTQAIGEPYQGRLRAGLYYRGFRVARLPEPLDKLRIPVGAVITSVNGTPVATGAEILAIAGTALKTKTRLFVEFVDGKQQRVIEYRLVE